MHVGCTKTEDTSRQNSSCRLQAPGGGFQTAKDKHAADLRAKGLPYPRRDPCGGVNGGAGGGHPGRPPLSGPAHLATRAVLGRGRGVAGAPATMRNHVSMAACLTRHLPGRVIKGPSNTHRHCLNLQQAAPLAAGRSGFRAPRQRCAGGGTEAGAAGDADEEADSPYSPHTLQLLAGGLWAAALVQRSR